MCILFAHCCRTSVRGYKLIMASNRDEFLNRPAECADFWKENKTIIGGRDMEKGREGGTWLATSLSKRRLAALLNVSGMPLLPDARGRGSLVSDFLLGDKTTKEYVSSIHENADEYGPFNLAMIDVLENYSELHFYSNSDKKLRTFNESIVIDNSQIDKPFQKSMVGLNRFQDIITQNLENKDKLINELLSLLQWKKKHVPDNVLQEIKRPDSFSSVFVNIPEINYGTRTHTIVLVDTDDNIDFVEWTMIPGEINWKVTHLQEKLTKTQ